MRFPIAVLLLLLAGCTTGATVSDETPLVAVAARLLQDPVVQAAKDVRICTGTDPFDYSPSPETLARMRALDARIGPCRGPAEAPQAVYLMLRKVRKEGEQYVVSAGLHCASAYFHGADCTDTAEFTVRMVDGAWRVTSEW
jgi:hypothetical protein